VPQRLLTLQGTVTVSAKAGAPCGSVFGLTVTRPKVYRSIPHARATLKQHHRHRVAGTGRVAADSAHRTPAWVGRAVGHELQAQAHQIVVAAELLDQTGHV
jgi:hypothetical protein